LIEDCAQCNGGRFRGKPLGSFGDMAIFSFQLNKNITCGEGGLVVTDRQDLADRIVAFQDGGYIRNKQGRIQRDGPVQGWGACVHMNELTAAFLLAQLQKLDIICHAMRSRNQQLYAGLSRIQGALPRLLEDPAGDAGNFVIMTWPTAEICDRIVELTRAAGVKPGPLGSGNIRMQDWGLHIYYHNNSLVKKVPTHSSGRPWSDPLNSWAADISYAKGTLPQTDDLVARSNLITVAPALTEHACQQIIEIYWQCAKQIGLNVQQ